MKSYITSENSLIHSFNPIVDKDSKVLILGSIPGIESLKRHQYYGHPRNQFWKVIYALSNEPYNEIYEERIQFLLDRGIGLWDVIDVCYRKGSLDSNIREERVNDFHKLFSDHPNIKHVFFNGAKAYETFCKKVGFDFDGIEFVRLGSTSPAHAIPFEKRIDDWKVVLEELDRSS